MTSVEQNLKKKKFSCCLLLVTNSIQAPKRTKEQDFHMTKPCEEQNITEISFMSRCIKPDFVSGIKVFVLVCFIIYMKTDITHLVTNVCE